MRHIIPISGKDSLATALVQKEAQPELEYEYVFNPTGAELPEVFSWIDSVEKYLNCPIARVGADLYEIIEDYNFFLPSGSARYCTRQSKIEPFEKWINKEDATVYYGIRADEDRGGYNNAKTPHITPRYPLKEHGIDLEGVYRVVSSVGLKPPMFFWQSVYRSVLEMVGQELIDALLEWQRDILFAGRSRANCYFCFSQRLYEWVWLLDNHPPLFATAKGMEGVGSKFIWNGNGQSLATIESRADEIRRKRVKAIVKIIRDIRDSKEVTQMSMFYLENEQGLNNYFNQTSCGLFCGK